MTGALVLVAVLVMAAFGIGYRVGHSDGRVAAMRWWRRVGRMGEMMQDARLEEPGNPRMN